MQIHIRVGHWRSWLSSEYILVVDGGPATSSNSGPELLDLELDRPLLKHPPYDLP